MQIDSSFPFALVSGVIAALIAADRGRSALGWFFVGLFLPCLGVILVLVMPDLKAEHEERDRAGLEARRIREQLRKERQVADARHAVVSERLGMHDREMGIDTARQVTSIQAVGALPPPPIPNPRAVEWWYVQDGERMGPVAFQTLRSLYQVRDVDGHTLVWCEAMQDWEVISALQELENALCA